MSYSIDVLQRCLHSYNCPAAARELVGAIHDFSHNHEDALNFDNKVRGAAERLETWLNEHEAHWKQVIAETKPIPPHKGAPRGRGKIPRDDRSA